MVAAADEDGVPVIAPVEELIVSPDGNDGDMAKEIGDVPPLDVTGINDVAAIPAVKVLLEIASVVESAVEIINAKVLELVAPLASVAVTV